MTQVLREPYWPKIVEYYYDNIHWSEDPIPSMYEWLERDYQGSTQLGAKYIHFKDDARANWFIMRWTTV